MAQRRIHRRVSPLLLLIAAVLVLGWAATALFLLVDPLDLYPWGARARLADPQYSMDGTPYLVDVVTKDGAIGTLFLGGSSGHQFTDAMMEATWPQSGRAFNLSHTSPRPADRELTQNKVLEFSHASRVIEEIDWRYQLPKALERRVDVTGNSFPLFLYDGTMWNDVRGVGLKTVLLSIRVALGGPVWIPDWSDRKWQRQAAGAFSRYHSPRAMAAREALIERHKRDVDTPSTRSCAELDVISQDLVPFARALSRHGVEMDVVFPVYSPSLYYEWVELEDRLRVNGESFMEDQLMLRRCVVLALADIPHVRVFDFDNVPGLADNSGNFRDSGHLSNPAAARFMLKAIARNEYRLTPENADKELKEMHQRIVDYRVTVGPPWQAPE